VAGSDLLSAGQMGVKPTLTALPSANSMKSPRAPPLLNEAIADDLALGVLRRMNQPETQPTRHWAPVFVQRKADSGKIEFRLGSTPQIQNRQLANRGGVPATEPTSDLGSSGGSVELLLPPRAASKRG